MNFTNKLQKAKLIFWTTALNYNIKVNIFLFIQNINIPTIIAV